MARLAAIPYPAMVGAALIACFLSASREVPTVPVSLPNRTDRVLGIRYRRTIPLDGEALKEETLQCRHPAHWPETKCTSLNEQLQKGTFYLLLIAAMGQQPVGQTAIAPEK